MMEKTIGWCVKKEECAYPIPMPQLSQEEEALVAKVIVRFGEEAKGREFEREKEAAEAIAQILAFQLDEDSLEADSEQQSYLARAAISHIRGFSFLDHLLLDSQVEEIACIGIGKPVYVYLRAQGWKRTNGYFTSQEHLANLANKIARPLGRRLSSQTPRLNAVLPDGSRLHASIPPLSKCEMTIRKFTQKPISAGELISLGAGTSLAFAFLSLAMQSDSSLLVAGNTSSGKTTLLGAMLSFIPMDERLLAIEETPELRFFHPHVARLLPSDEHGISMEELVRDSLRMRPDRVVVGEIRTKPECLAWMDSVLSGQARGSYATFHAQSPHEALRRLASSGVDKEDLPSIDYIVVQRRLAQYDCKKRRMREARKIVSISSVQKDGVPATLFNYSHEKGMLAPTSALKAELAALACRLGMGAAEIRKELPQREGFFKSASSRISGFEKELADFQRFAYG